MGEDSAEMEHLAVYIQQAAAAKAIGILTKQSNLIADQFLSVILMFY